MPPAVSGNKNPPPSTPENPGHTISGNPGRPGAIAVVAQPATPAELIPAVEMAAAQ